MVMFNMREAYVIGRLAETNFETLVFASRLQRATRRWDLSDKERWQLASLMGLNICQPDMLLSDIGLRMQSRATLVRSLENVVPRVTEPGTPIYLFTFADQCGITSDRAPVLSINTLSGKIDKAVRALGLSGVVQLEIQGIVNYPQRGLGRTLLLHGHGICWGGIKQSDLQVMVDELNASRSWSNSFGIEPIKFRHLTGDIDEMIAMGFYTDKMPKSGKNLVPSRRRPGKFILQETLRGYRDEFALRIWEGLSHIPIVDAVIGINDGKYVRKVWKPSLTAWHRERLRTRLACSSVDVPTFWSGVRQRNGSINYEAYNVV